MALQDNIAAVRSILLGVSGVANVYDTVRNWQSEKDFREAARTASGGTQFWFITRESSAAQDLGPQFTRRRHLLAIHAYAGVHDAVESERSFQALIEAAAAALDADRKLNQTARHSGPVQVRAVDFRVINNVLCHHAELTLGAEDDPA
jgi:hypothetical protein